jgi:DNA mismatch repair protein MutS2
VDGAGPGTLVLLDELGAGTDPTEGSALAQALLDHFIRSGAIVAATTHYAELKAYAHTTPSARNAAVAFDLDTLSPTYALTIGLPGGSQAFAIAERLGLPAEIVDDARSRLTDAQRTFESTLASIRSTEGKVSAALDQARASEARASAALAEAQETRRKARREAREATEAARAEADTILEDLRAEVAVTRGALERETITAVSLDAAVADVEAVADRLPRRERVPEPMPEERPAWRIGDRAVSRAGGWEGRISALDRDGRRATLEAGALRVAVDVDDLVPVRSGPSGEAASDPSSDVAAVGSQNASVVALRAQRARAVASSLDLRGARVEEALIALERYLDDAGLAGLPSATIIHGSGTGALRDAVRQSAGRHPLVSAVRPGERGEGGEGATIVTF